MESATPPTKRGRPRSTTRHHAILDSTRALLASGSYDELTMDAIATRARVSKQTVYKWWPSKAALVTEAVLAGYLTVATDQLADTGDIAADLGEWFYARVEQLDNLNAVALVRAMTAAAADGTSDPQRLYDQQTEPHRRNLLQRLSCAVGQGQLRRDADLEAATDAILGTVLLWTLSPARAGREDADGLIGVLLNGMAAHAPHRAEARTT